MPERPMRPQPFTQDGQHCHCGYRLACGTDGNGRAIQWCSRCGAESCVLPIRPERRSVESRPAVCTQCGAEPTTPKSELGVACQRERDQRLRREWSAKRRAERRAADGRAA